MFDALMDRIDVLVQRDTVTKDAQGGTVRNFTTVIPAGFRCSIQSASTGDWDYWNRRQIKCDMVIYSLYDFDATLAGGLQVGDRFVDGDGIIYAVTGVRKDKNTKLNALALYDIAVLQIRNNRSL